MDMSKKLTCFTGVLAVSFFAGTADAATWGVSPQIGVMKNADGTAGLPSGSIAMINDADGDGFGAIGTTNSYGTDDEGDVLLDVFNIGTFFGSEGFWSGTFTGDAGYKTPNNTDVMFVFFDNDFATSTDAPGEGTDFGIVPEILNVGQGGNLTVSWTTTEVFGTNDPSTLYANAGSVVPEPASLALLGLGGLLVARRRR